MDKQEILDRLLNMHEAYYDVEHGHAYKGLVFDGYAEFHSEASQYVLSRRAKLWGANTHEFVFFLLVNHLTNQRVQELVDFMTTCALDKIELNPEHMTSYLSLVIIADTADDDACESIRKARFRKNFKFGLQGWADLRLALADLSSCRIITNNCGEEIIDTLQRCIERGKAQTA